jgi:hypothetical protein
MRRKRKLKFLLAGGLITLVGVTGMEQFVVRDLLASFIIFCAFFVALGITILVSFLLGDGVVRCYEVLVSFAASFRRRQPARSVVGPLTRRCGVASAPILIRSDTRPEAPNHQPMPFSSARISKHPPIGAGVRG